MTDPQPDPQHALTGWTFGEVAAFIGPYTNIPPEAVHDFVIIARDNRGSYHVNGSDNITPGTELHQFVATALAVLLGAPFMSHVSVDLPPRHTVCPQCFTEHFGAVPTDVAGAPEEPCCNCGTLTAAGIYVFAAGMPSCPGHEDEGGPPSEKPGEPA